MKVCCSPVVAVCTGGEGCLCGEDAVPVEQVGLAGGGEGDAEAAGEGVPGVGAGWCGFGGWFGVEVDVEVAFGGVEIADRIRTSSGSSAARRARPATGTSGHSSGKRGADVVVPRDEQLRQG
jgi:hypothetical protein